MAAGSVERRACAGDLQISLHVFLKRRWRICDLKVTLFEYLVAVQIKAIAATKMNFRLGYAALPGLGDVASRWLISWAAHRGMDADQPGPMHAKVWPGPNNGRIGPMMRSETSENFHEATKALALAVAGLMAITLMDLFLLIPHWLGPNENYQESEPCISDLEYVLK
jgi:hypothetical protein